MAKVNWQSCSQNFRVSWNIFLPLGGDFQPWSWQLLPPVYGLVVSSLLDLLDKLPNHSKLNFNKSSGTTRRETMETTGLTPPPSHQSLSKVTLTNPSPANVLPWEFLPLTWMRLYLCPARPGQGGEELPSLPEEEEGRDSPVQVRPFRPRGSKIDNILYSSGLVFCYVCIVKYLRRHGKVGSG